MKKHTVTFDQIFKDKVLIQYENILASSHGMGESKELIVRTTLNGYSNTTDVLFMVKDCTKIYETGNEILMITGHLQSAIDCYNRI